MQAFFGLCCSSLGLGQVAFELVVHGLQILAALLE
jgi:hypothetical protein